MEKVQSITEEEQGFPELTAVYRVCLELQELATPETTARQVIRILEETLGYEFGAVLLIDEAAGLLKPFALSERGYGPDPDAADIAYSTKNDLRLEIGVTGWVAQNGQSVRLADVRQDSHYVAMRDDIRSEMCVPMRVGERVIGVINVESTQLDAYSERDQQVLETVASQVAMAIQNAQLFARLQKCASENEELNAFGHTVAHDLKNPLAILLGFAEVLKYEYMNGDDTLLSQGIQVILENGMRMASIIDELLLLAEVRQLEDIELEPLNMSNIVDEVQKRLSNLINKEGATIIEPPMWPAALGHQMWVQEIWINYVSNAIKYGGRPPRVELEAKVRPDGMAQFWVCDNGSGITQEDQDRLFTPFTQLNRVRVEGHGLGLSIVQRIVTKLGGEVGIESVVDQGSKFWFTLPTIQEE